MDDVIRRAYEVLDAGDETLARPRPAPGTEWRLPEPEPERRTAVPPLTRGHVLAAIEAGLEAERRAIRAHVNKRIDEFAAVIGEEVRKVEDALREQFRREMELVQSAHQLDLQNLRAELTQPRERRRATVGRNGHAGVQ